MNPALKMRLMRDLFNMHKGTVENIDLIIGSPSKDLLTWIAMLFGPDGSLFEDTIIELKLIFPLDYPNTPPYVYFETEIFHPNIAKGGSFYLDILTQESWRPDFDVLFILRSIRKLLGRPDLKNILNYEAALIYRNNFQEYIRRNQARI